MNRLGNQHQQPTRFFFAPTRFFIVCLVICSVAIVSCSPPNVGSQAEIDAAVEATVAVAVEATVSAQSGTSSTVAGMVESATADTSQNQNENTDDAVAAAVPELSEQELEVAQWVTSQTRHYIGDPNAPVVFIEFSDFQ